MFPYKVSSASRKPVSGFSLFTVGHLSNFSSKFPIDYHQDFLCLGAFERFHVSCEEEFRLPKHTAIR